MKRNDAAAALAALLAALYLQAVHLMPRLDLSLLAEGGTLTCYVFSLLLIDRCREP